MRFKPAVFAGVSFAMLLGACQSEVTTPPTPQTRALEAAPSLAVGQGQSSARAMATAAAQQMIANGRTSGAFFLPPFSIDGDGNIINAGTGGFLFAAFWPTGGLKGVCLFFTGSQTNFFRVGPNEIAMDHVNGPAFAGVFARSTEDGMPLPGLDGMGKLTFNVQGTLGIDTFVNDPTTGQTISFYYVAQPTSATVFNGVARVGEAGGPADQQLRCSFVDDANGNRRAESFSVR